MSLFLLFECRLSQGEIHLSMIGFGYPRGLRRSLKLERLDVRGGFAFKPFPFEYNCIMKIYFVL